MKMKLARIALVVLTATLLIGSCTGLVFACSGTHTGELMAHNRLIVNVYGIVAMVLFLGTVAIYFVRGRAGMLAIVLSLLIGFFHPFWHDGGGAGDCGRSLVELAKYVTILLAGLLVMQAVLWRLKSPRIIVTRNRRDTYEKC